MYSYIIYNYIIYIYIGWLMIIAYCWYRLGSQLPQWGSTEI